jgi:hypothetical protein
LKIVSPRAIRSSIFRGVGLAILLERIGAGSASVSYAIDS